MLQIIGVGARLAELELKEREIYNERLTVGRIADQKEKYAKEQIYYPDAPKELVSASELIKEQQGILAQNGENQRLRENLYKLEQEKQSINDQIQELLGRQSEVEEKLRVARMSTEDLQDQSTKDLEDNIANIEEVNRKVRANLDKEKAEEDAQDYLRQYGRLSSDLDEVRKSKMALLHEADLPLPGLSVEEGELIYNGHKWDNMSGSDQLKVATAIVRKLNPNCGFVLLDKLEQMDVATLNEFGSWLEEEGLQAIATRVSTGGECSIIIEDGYVADQESPAAGDIKTWKEGDF